MLDPEKATYRALTLSRKSRISAYAVMDASRNLVAKIRIVRSMNKNITKVYVYCMGDANWQEGVARGYGYDKESAGFDGLRIGDLTYKDGGARWVDALYIKGYDVIHVL